jgi:hypothetical protein
METKKMTKKATDVKLITAQEAETACRSLEKRVVKAITTRMQSLTGVNYLVVEDADIIITWFGGGNHVLAEVSIEDNVIFVKNDLGEKNRLEPSELCTFDLIAILEAIENTVI